MLNKVLMELNQEVGVKGCMIIDRDGLVVTSEIGDDLDKEIVAAVASNTIKSTKRALASFGQGMFDRFILMAAYGRMVFVDIEVACLLVVTEPNISIDLTLLSIDSAGRRIRNTLKM